MSNDNDNSENSIKLEEDEIERSVESDLDKQQPLSSKKRLHRKQDISNFIIKTYRILEDRRNAHIIEWTDNGNCFIVKSKEQFENEILPKYFKHKKFSSFVRQLNMYDFHKIRKEKEIPIFKHKFFKMDCFDLLHKIKRKSGEDGKEEDNFKNGVSQVEVSLKNEEVPFKSLISLKSKGTFNVNDEIEFLMAQNSDLRSSISEIGKQMTQLELNKNKKQQKLVKLLSALVYFDSKQSLDGPEEKVSLRELERHFLSDDEPLSFLEYANKVGYIYRQIYKQFAEV